MAMHKTLQNLNTKYPNKPANSFTDCINALYPLNLQIQHPSIHNNHPNKTLLESMVQLLKSRTKPTNLHKVRAHVGIERYKCAKIGSGKDHRKANQPYKHAIHYHTNIKERNGHPWTKLQTKDLLDFWQNTSKNMTLTITSLKLPTTF